MLREVSSVRRRAAPPSHRLYRSAAAVPPERLVGARSGPQTSRYVLNLPPRCSRDLGAGSGPIARRRGWALPRRSGRGCLPAVEAVASNAQGPVQSRLPEDSWEWLRRSCGASTTGSQVPLSLLLEGHPASVQASVRGGLGRVRVRDSMVSGHMHDAGCRARQFCGCGQASARPCPAGIAAGADRASRPAGGSVVRDRVPAGIPAAGVRW
jgi:hypothetical protein